MHIVLEGLRENNLKGIQLKIPKRKITVFTGVSGSGESSLVFDTIGRETKRQLMRRSPYIFATACPSMVNQM